MVNSHAHQDAFARTIAPLLYHGTPCVLLGVAESRPRIQIREALTDVDCSVVEVADGYRLIEYLADSLLEDSVRLRPDIIIADAQLPGCTGHSLLEGLRDLDWDVPVILLSESDHRPEDEAAWELGATALFVAPVDLRELCAFSLLVLDQRFRGTFRPRSKPYRTLLHDGSRAANILREKTI